jgi:ribose-phosphate pyrophosphokinase
MALLELQTLGVNNLITFDAHDSRVANSIPLGGFEDVKTTYQMLKALLRTTPDVHVDKNALMVVSPDEGGMSRCIYYANMLGVDVGMFYKRRDYSVVVKGRNPIIAHEFLGDNVRGKDIIVPDDMISSGDSTIEVATKLKNLGAKRIFVCASFGLFCNGLDRFGAAHAADLIDKVFTTNLIYNPPALLAAPWHVCVDMSKYISYLIDTINHDRSLSRLLTPNDRIARLLAHHQLENAHE